MRREGSLQSAGGDAPLVRIHTLGRFLVEVDGEALVFEGKSRRKPLELLKVLIALGGDRVPVTTLGEALWPDAEGDQVYGNFSTTLSRLRKMIGADCAVLQDGRLILDARKCWVDALALPGLLKEAVGAAEQNRGDDTWSLAERALDVYRGPFLEGEFDPPEILSARERLHGVFLRHIGIIGRMLRSSGMAERAALLFRRGLEIDDLAEEFYQSLMHCHLEADRVVEGIAVYQRCKQIFQTTVGISPSPETEALYRQLLAQRAAPDGPTVVHEDRDGGLEPVAASAVTLASAAPTELAFAGGERRRATVACHLLIGYDELCEAQDLETADRVLRLVRREIDSVVQRFGGIVNHAIRDEAVAIYGVPTAHEDDPRRAVQATLALHRRMQRFQPMLLSRLSQHLDLQSGVDTGLLMIRREEARHGRFAITGRAANRAVALARGSPRGAIMIGEETHGLVQPFFRTVRVKAPEGAAASDRDASWRALAQTGVSDRFEVAERQGFTPYAGREQELSGLAERLRQARTGSGHLVALVAEAGMGKSRLIREFWESDACADVVRLHAACREQRANILYAPFLELLRTGLRLPQGDSPTRLYRKVVRSVKALDHSLEPFLPYYLHFLSLPGRDYALPESLPGEELRRGIVDGLVAILTVVLRRRPMVVVIEDLHWSDGATTAALLNLTGVIAQYPLLLVVSYRTELDVQWGHLGHLATIELGALDIPHVGAMLSYLFGAESLQDGLAERVCAHTEGNPFFVEELSHALREEGAVTVENGRARVSGSLAQLGAPDTVQAVIRARLDRLPQEALRVLRIAAVIGQEFAGRVLDRVTPAGADLGQAMETLRSAEIVRQTHVFPEVQYRFRHNLTQWVVYETLLLPQRRMLHQRVGEAIEALYQMRLEEHYEALARHYVGGTNPDKALSYLNLAGQKAARVFSLQEARAHFQAAVRLFEGLEPTLERKIAGIDVAIRLGRVSFYAPSRELLRTMQGAVATARDLGDEDRLSAAMFIAGMINYALGNHVEAKRSFLHCLELPGVVNNGPLKAVLLSYLGRVCSYLTEFDQAAAYLEESAEQLRGFGDTTEVANSFAMLGIVHGFCGNIPAALDATARAIEIGEETGNLAIVGNAHVSRAIVQNYAGMWRDARVTAAKAIEICRSINNTVAEAMGMWAQGLAVAMSGDPGDGAALMSAGIDMIEATESRIALSGFCAELARVYVLNGRIKEARVYVEKSRLIAASGQDRFSEMMTPGVEAMLAAGEHGTASQRTAGKGAKSPKPLAAVNASMGEALRVCEACGARTHAAIHRYHFATLLRQLGQRKAAQNQLETAQTLFAESGMVGWTQRATALREEWRAK